MTVSQSLVRNRRAFLSIGMLATGVAVLAACGATAANTGLTNAERAAYEAKAAEMAADLVADTSPKVKIKGSSKKEGTVKFYNSAKGFGFIVPSESGDEDVFVHNTGLIDEIRENDKVQYDVERGRKGLIAVNVVVNY